MADMHSQGRDFYCIKGHDFLDKFLMYSHACREKNSGFVRLRHCSFRWEIRLYFLGGRKNRFCEAEALFFSVGNKIKLSWGRKIKYSQADASNKIQPFIFKKESFLDFFPKTSKQHSKYYTPSL